MQKKSNEGMTSRSRHQVAKEENGS